MKKLLLIFISLLSFSAWALPNIPRPPALAAESWIKLTCFGVTSPSGAYPTVERQIIIGHIPFNGSLKYPSFADLRDQNSAWFKNFTKVCTERRRAKVEMGSFTGQWLGWGTDWGYTRYTIGEQYISAANSLQCRGVGGPCVRNSQCCGAGQFQSYCNVGVKTCESNLVEANQQAMQRN